MAKEIDPDLDAALNRLGSKMGVGESQEVQRHRRHQHHQAHEVRRQFNRDGFYTQHDDSAARRSAAEAQRRYR